MTDYKPTVRLSGQNGNIFNLIGIASKALPRDKASEMQNRIFKSGSYEEALQIIAEYVEVE